MFKRDNSRIIRALNKFFGDKGQIIRIKCLDPDCFPHRTITGDWIDLSSYEDVYLHEGEYKEISLGVAIELPSGYEAIVAPRSSTFKRYSCLLANSIGIIDELYNGDGDIWHFPVIAVRDTCIPKGTRIAQFRIIKHQPPVALYEVDTLGNDNRGGLGSTGE